MDNGVTVLCDIHLTSMQLEKHTFVVPPSDRWDTYFMHCQEPGCTRYFNSLHGYVDIRDRRIVGESRKIRGCPNEPKHFGSVGIVKLGDSGEPVWACIHRDCKSKEC